MNRKGFALIELLIAIGILLFLLGMGIVNYISFNDRQKLTQAAEIVRESVASAQISARSGKLRGCGELKAYQIAMSNLSSTGVITISPVCVAGTGSEQQVANLPSGVQFSISHPLYSRAVTGIIDNNLVQTDGEPASNPVVLESNSGEVNLSIYSSGAVISGIEDVEPTPTPTLVYAPCSCAGEPPACANGIPDCIDEGAGLCNWGCVPVENL